MQQIGPSGAHFVDFWSQGLKMLKSRLLELILSTSGAQAGIPQIEPSAAHFVVFWSQGLKIAFFDQNHCVFKHFLRES